MLGKQIPALPTTQIVGELLERFAMLLGRKLHPHRLPQWPGVIEHLLLILDMALRHPQPPQVNGAIYDFLDIKMSLSTQLHDGRLALPLVVTLTPYRQLGEGIEHLTEGSKTFIWGDALLSAEDDNRLALFLSRIESAGQALIDEVF